jgi:hypothetical protein
MHQRPYRLDDLEFVLRNVRKDRDTYMSQGFFARPNRRAIHLAYATHAYVDLDVYKVPAKAGRLPEDIAHALLMHCGDNNIPLPSAIISSGRGLYAKWFWRHPIPRAAAGRAVAVNRALVRRFTEFGADPLAVDMSRILRVVGTVNTKSGEIARLLWMNECEGDVVTYHFDDFADEVLRYTLEQIREWRAEDTARREKRQAEARLQSRERVRQPQQGAARERRRGTGRAFSWEDWHWGILEDLRILARLRFGGRVHYADGSAKAGADLFGHIGACQLAMVFPVSVLWQEILAWGRLILPLEYVNSPDFARHCSTLLADAKRAAQGETVRWRGQARNPIWTYRKTTLIERLEITTDEQRSLTRLIDADEMHRRARQAWQMAHTGLDRTGYEAQANARRIQVNALREQGKSFRAIARILGISPAEAHRLSHATRCSGSLVYLPSAQPPEGDPIPVPVRTVELT